MTLDQAVARAHALQADLEAGRLTVPYPELVRRELLDLGAVFADHCKTPEQARALVQRLHEKPAPVPQTAELPW